MFGGLGLTTTGGGAIVPQARTVPAGTVGVVTQLKASSLRAPVTYSKLSGAAGITVSSAGVVSLTTGLGNGVSAVVIVRAVGAQSTAAEWQLTLTGLTVTQAGAPVANLAPVILGNPADGSAWMLSLGAWALATSFDIELRTVEATPVVLLARQSATFDTAGTISSAAGKTVELRVWAKNGGQETLGISAPFGPVTGSPAFSVSGAPKLTTVATQAALLTAITAAQPGEVVTLSTAVAPFALTINQPKAAPGISIVLPPQQVVSVAFSGANLNTEIVGGTASFDTVVGNATANPAYSVSLGSASRMAVRGMRLSQGTNLVCSVGGATDWEVTDCLAEFARGDVMQLVRCKRFLIDRVFGRDSTIKGQKILWFTTGAQPQDSVADTSNGTTSFYADTTHNDFIQWRNQNGLADFTQDFAIRNVDAWVLGAGIVSYGNLASGGEKGVRGQIANCNIRSMDNGAIVADGNDLEIINNTVGPHPTDPGTGGGSVNITLTRNPVGARVRGGGNSAINGALLVNPTGVDLGATLPNGDVVNAPALPNLFRPAWFPAVTAPTYTAYQGTPVVVTPPDIFSFPATPVVGTYLTAGVGRIKGFENSTGEWRWCRNGAPISGATGRVYQCQSADNGQSITVETRRTNPFGTGAWVASAAKILNAIATPVNSVAPVLSGTAQEGQTLSVTTGTWSGSPTFAYQWLRGGTPIAGSVNATRVLTAADIGAVMTCSVTATNGGGSASAASNGSAAVIAAAVPVPTNTAAPVVSGATTIGSMLTSTNGTWTNSPSSYAYQWRRNGVDIAGATGSTYTLVTADTGTSVLCRVFATNAGGTSAASSNAIAATAAPTITGTPPPLVIGQPYDFQYTVTPPGSVTFDAASVSFFASKNISHDGTGRLTSASVS